MTSGDIKVVNLVTTESRQFRKHINTNNTVHLVNDNIASGFTRSIDMTIDNVQDNFTNKRYIMSKTYIEKHSQDKFDITL